MVKRFIMLIILLAGTALTVFLGEGFDFLNPDPTATVAITTTVATTEVAETIVVTETAAPTATLEATGTEIPTATEEMTATVTSTATATATPTNTPTSTATATPTQNTDLFEVQTGSPVYTVNFAHPDAACNWQGVAGQVLSKTGAPLTNYILKISGKYNGLSINLIGLSGLVTNTPYGPGSFEFVLGTTAIASDDLLTIQVFSPTGTEVLGPVSIDTYASCSKNLQIINFQAK
ncbi:MAG: hypothetical protein CVU42_09280 [Chloroflexi bacterium HGW-Chloroflexi-4]|jgi:hypothetical protein|nr:MAG: hypothetical protein CVU42_09280 [Chloroflexi bacterium HGW-Chloroflexi-4]